MLLNIQYPAPNAKVWKCVQLLVHGVAYIAPVENTAGGLEKLLRNVQLLSLPKVPVFHTVS